MASSVSSVVNQHIVADDDASSSSGVEGACTSHTEGRCTALITSVCCAGVFCLCVAYFNVRSV